MVYNLKNILDLTQDELKEILKENGEKAFRAEQVFTYIKNKVFKFSEMKNIGPSTREFLEKNFVLELPEVIKILESSDGTKKALMKLNDNNIIESVLMKYQHGYSVCISTQIGCLMGCKFCASTKEGKVRDLTAGEMLSQIIKWEEIFDIRVSNVVLMGAGEPFDNFENVKKFLEIVTSPYSLNIGQRHITISTCGIAPKIKEFADLNNQVTLAISLHETDNEKRKALMPITNKYDLTELFQSLKYYQSKTKRRITFEYALVKDTNDKKEDAIKLAKLLKGLKSHVNLIPLNEIKDSLLKKPDMKKVRDFLNTLEEFNIETTIRMEKGSDIMAACGQLKRSFLSDEESR